MKQKAVIRISMNDDKSRKKALKTIVCCAGVESAAVQGSDKDVVEVIGEGIDAVKITTALRKNVGHSEIVSVVAVEEKKAEKKEESKAVTESVPTVIYTSHPYGYSMVPPYHYHEIPSSDPCSIM